MIQGMPHASAYGTLIVCQVVRAQECEANTGSAGPAGGNDGAAVGDAPDDVRDLARIEVATNVQ